MTSKSTSLAASVAMPAETHASSSKAIDKAGVKAGISIGVIAGVLLLAALIWWIYKRFFSGTRLNERNRRPRPIPNTVPYAPPLEGDPYALNQPTTSPPQPPPIQPSRLEVNTPALPANDYEKGAPSVAQPITGNWASTVTSGRYNRSTATSMERPVSFTSSNPSEQYGNNVGDRMADFRRQII